MKPVPTLALCLLAFIPGLASSEIFFDENFENAEVYTVGQPVPPDFNQIHYGCWFNLDKRYQPGVVAGDEGGNRWVELRPKAGQKAARVIACFGRSNIATEAIYAPLRIRLSFQFEGTLPEDLVFQVLGGDGKSRATILVGSGDQLQVSFGGNRHPFGPRLEPGRWYVLEMKLPPSPATHSRWTANLYETDGTTLLESQEGRVSRSVAENGGNYRSLDILHRVPDHTVLIDNLRVETDPAP